MQTTERNVSHTRLTDANVYSRNTNLMAKPARIPKKGGRFHHGNLRPALIQAALQVLRQRGAEAITLREIARLTGVTHTAPYRHFSDKDALLAAVAADGFRVLGERMKQVKGANPLDQLLEIGVHYIHFAAQNPEQFRLMYGPELAARKSHPDLQTAAATAFRLLVEVVEAAQHDCLVRDGDRVEIALTAWSMVHGLSLLILDHQLEDAGVGKSEVKRVVDFATQALRDGLRR